ncbi:MAG: hypothetical protein WCH11_06280 [Bdellovibrio sp.]
MEKISGILPSRPRLKSVDLQSAHPIRPGVPSFGRPVGSTSVQRDRVNLSMQARELASQAMAFTPKQASELSKTALADKLGRDFFASRLEDSLDRDAKLSEIDSGSPSAFSGPESVDVVEPSFQQEAMGLQSDNLRDAE